MQKSRQPTFQDSPHPRALPSLKSPSLQGLTQPKVHSPQGLMRPRVPSPWGITRPEVLMLFYFFILPSSYPVGTSKHVKLLYFCGGELFHFVRVNCSSYTTMRYKHETIEWVQLGDQQSGAIQWQEAINLSSTYSHLVFHFL